MTEIRLYPSGNVITLPGDQWTVGDTFRISRTNYRTITGRDADDMLVSTR